MKLYLHGWGGLRSYDCSTGFLSDDKGIPSRIVSQSLQYPQKLKMNRINTSTCTQSNKILRQCNIRKIMFVKYANDYVTL